jgi:hypothetical protein
MVSTGTGAVDHEGLGWPQAFGLESPMDRHASAREDVRQKLVFFIEEMQLDLAELKSALERGDAPMNAEHLQKTVNDILSLNAQYELLWRS